MWSYFKRNPMPSPVNTSTSISFAHFCHHLRFSSVSPFSFRKYPEHLRIYFKSYRFCLLFKFFQTIYFKRLNEENPKQCENFIYLSKKNYCSKSIANSSYYLYSSLTVCWLVSNFAWFLCKMCMCMWTRANDSKCDNCMAELF